MLAVCSVTDAVNLAILHRTAPTRFLPQEHYTTETGLIQGHDISTWKGTDHTPPTMSTNIGDNSTNHNHAAIPTMTGAAAVPEGTLHSPSCHCRSSCCPLADGHLHCHSCHDTPNRHSHTHSTLATSPTDMTHTTIPQTRAGLTGATLTTWDSKHSQ